MLAAELMAKFVPSASEVAVVTGMVETEDNGKKVSGFTEIFQRECPGGKIVDVIEGHEQQEQTFRKCARLLRSHPHLAGVYISTVIAFRSPFYLPKPLQAGANRRTPDRRPSIARH